MVAALAGLSTACGGSGGGSADVEAGSPGSIDRFPIPIDQFWPESESGQLPASSLDALGPSTALVGSWSASFEPVEYLVIDTSDGTLTDVPEPPIDGVSVAGGSANHANGAVLVRPICPSREQLVEVGAGLTCTGGFAGVGVWELTATTLEWKEVAFLDPADLGVSDAAGLVVEVPGIVGNAVYIRSRNELGDGEGGLYQVHLETGRLGRVTEVPDETAIECVTGSGVIAGTQPAGDVPEVISGSDVPVLELRLVLHGRGASGWSVVDDLMVTDRDRIGCTDNGVVIAGETSAAGREVRWTEVSTSGRIVADEVLPAEVAGRGRHVYHIFVGEGTAHLGFVRAFDSPSEDESEVVVMTAVDAEPVVAGLSVDPFEVVFDAGRTADGDVFLLVFRASDDDLPAELTLLVAGGCPDGPAGREAPRQPVGPPSAASR